MTSRRSTAQVTSIELLLDLVVDGIPADAVLRQLERDGLDTPENVGRLFDVSASLHQLAMRREGFKDHAVWMSAIYRCLINSNQQIRRVREIDRATFYRDYYSVNRPVLLEPEAASSGHESFPWQVERVKELWGDFEGEVTSNDRSISGSDEPARRNGSVKSFLADTFSSLVSKCYLTATVDEVSSATLLHSKSLERFLKLLSGPAQRPSICIASSDSTAPLRFDATNLLLVQLVGTSRVVLVPPHDECFLYWDLETLTSPVDVENPKDDEHKLFQFAHRNDVELEPGCGLFVPIGWWHFKHNLTPSVQLSLTNFRAANSFVDSPF